jgi:acetyl-CoA carboxylase biotin carboxyl carrier protein
MAANEERSVSNEEPAGAPGPHVNGSYANGGPVLLDLEFVRQLIQVVDASGIDTVEIARGGTRIRISKTPAPAPMPAAVLAASGSASPSAAPVAPGTPGAPQPVESPPAAPSRNLTDVRSPMVGTFYRAPAPEAPPYVEVGSSVTRGQTLCILEAMKLMNEMESEVEGIVREILVENADPVEYGQVLFRIEPTKPA